MSSAHLSAKKDSAICPFMFPAHWSLLLSINRVSEPLPAISHLYRNLRLSLFFPFLPQLSLHASHDFRSYQTQPKKNVVIILDCHKCVDKAHIDLWGEILMPESSPASLRGISAAVMDSLQQDPKRSI